MISIIIPANNEENVIAETLMELTPGVLGGELEIIVVCNGCTDNTAAVVASFGESVRCIETTTPSKTNALNLGDAAAKGFPRIYQDADVILSLDAVRQIAQQLDGGYLVAYPRLKMKYQHASWAVRSFYDVWQSLPYLKTGMIGTGVFALSEEGRSKFSQFPIIISDDGYIRSLFKTHERISVDSCYSLVRAPANLQGLLKIKTRSRLGGYELKKRFPEVMDNDQKKYCSAICGLLTHPGLWPKIPVYFYVNLIARLRAAKHARTHGFIGWERDNTSRNMV